MDDHLKNITDSRNYLENVINSMIDIVVVIDREFMIQSINDATSDFLEYTSEELIGEGFFALVADKEKWGGNSNELLEKGRISDIEIEYKTKTGMIIPMLLSASIIRDDAKLSSNILIVAKDITAWKKAEEVLTRKHEELNALFDQVDLANKERQKIMDAVGDMIILIDHEGSIRRANKAVADFAGKPFDQILMMKWEELLQEAELEAVTLHSDSTELIHVPTRKWFTLNSYPFEDPEFSFSGTVITIHETTEIKLIAEELEKTNSEIDENRKKLQRALDETSKLIDSVIQSTDHIVRFTNPDIKKCYEIKDCKKENCPCYGKEAMRCWKIAGTYCGGEIQGAFAQKYGNCSVCEVYKEATTDPIYQIGEHFNNMMHILEVKSRELEGAYRELKETQSQMVQKEKMASVGQLAAGVAHEINNPTGFIMSNLGTLGKYVDKITEFINAQAEVLESLQEAEALEELQEKRKKLKLDYVLEDIGLLIGESIDGADRIKQIVQNLKSFSRIDEAGMKPSDINECIESTLQMVWNELKYKATVEKELGNIPLTMCSPNEMNQVFVNLLVNASHAIEKQGEIKIKTWNDDGSINISISDTGTGIPEDIVGRIFEPFFTTKEVGKGTGLGLSITYDIIKKHNGEMFVKSEQGRGTIFTVQIPVVDGNVDHDGQVDNNITGQHPNP